MGALYVECEMRDEDFSDGDSSSTRAMRCRDSSLMVREGALFEQCRRGVDWERCERGIAFLIDHEVRMSHPLPLYPL